MKMIGTMLLIIGMLLGSTRVRPQDRAQGFPDPTFYTVSYAESIPAGRGQAVAAFKNYADASRKQNGFIRVEIFEQAGRPGHFALIETWRDQSVFDLRDSSIQKQLLEGIASVRVANYDQRPYKTLTLGSPWAANRQAVYVITHVDVSNNPQVPMLLQRISSASRQEEGNLRYDVLQHTMRANHFTIIEAWRNDQARVVHAAAPHTKQYRDELGPFLGSPLDERIYAVVE